MFLSGPPSAPSVEPFFSAEGDKLLTRFEDRLRLSYPPPSLPCTAFLEISALVIAGWLLSPTSFVPRVSCHLLLLNTKRWVEFWTIMVDINWNFKFQRSCPCPRQTRAIMSVSCQTLDPSVSRTSMPWSLRYVPLLSVVTGEGARHTRPPQASHFGLVDLQATELLQTLPYTHKILIGI